MCLIALLRAQLDEPRFVIGLTLIEVWMTDDKVINRSRPHRQNLCMTVECPQCKAPQPRSGSRFCNQCGADLRSPEAVPEQSPLTVAPEASNGDADDTFVTDAIDPAETIVPPGKAMLRILLRDGSVFERELTNGETKIGKGALNDIILPDPAVSTSHALIQWDSTRFVITDLGSRNGTLVNDTRLAEPRVLAHGDRIKMGRCTLTLRLGQGQGQGSDTVILAHQPLAGAVAARPQVVTQVKVTEDDLAAAVVGAGLIDLEACRQLRETGTKGRSLFRALIEDHNLRDVQLRDLMSSKFGIPITDPKGLNIDQGIIAALSARVMREHLLFPAAVQTDRLILIVADPTDNTRIDKAKSVAKRPVELRLGSATQIASELDQQYAPRLIGVLPSGEKVEALITEPEIEIGKASHNHIVLTQRTVSNTHAVILTRSGGYSIVDLGSSNGTFVNGERLTDQARTLQHGDKVQIAEVVLTFRNPAETTESKTARLSPEILEEIKKRAELGLPISTASPASRRGEAAAEDDDKADKKKKAKKKDDDRLKAALVNSMSRLVATVVGSILTVVGTLYLIRSPGMFGGGGGNPGAGNTPAVARARLSPPGTFTAFTGGTFEASGASWVEDTNTMLLIDDGKPGQILQMTVDQSGRQVGALAPISHNGQIIDAEAITQDGTWFYVVSSSGDPKNGPKNALMRFAYDRQSKSIRGNPETIPDLRGFLLSNIPELGPDAQKPSTKGGLNIEGLGWDPVNNRLLVGLRQPVINGRALLVPLKLKDPLGAFTASNLQLASPRVIQLNLGGQGVRDIDYNNHLKSFLIISGATELTHKTDFGLWEWNGDADQSSAASHPRQERTLDERHKPEGITNVTINSRSFVLVVCDANGYFKLDYLD